MVFRDDFRGGSLDRAVWLPHYLPAWSSRAETAASYDLTPEGLRLYIPTDAALWCPDDHPEPLRVSGLQSGNRSGPVGSTDGQQRFRDDLVVRELQPRFEGWLQASGRVEIRCRMRLSPRSMAAMWLSGFEEHPDESGELCVVEVFGRSIGTDNTAEVGVGVKRLYDPHLTDDFIAPSCPIDVNGFHTYAVTWGDGAAEFLVDDVLVHRSPQAPAYPMQIMIAVFDFPDWSTGDDNQLMPELVVDRIEGDSPEANLVHRARAST